MKTEGKIRWGKLNKTLADRSYFQACSEATSRSYLYCICLTHILIRRIIGIMHHQAPYINPYQPN